MCRGKRAFFNRGDKLAMTGVNIYAVVEINGRISIYGSQPDKMWLSSAS